MRNIGISVKPPEKACNDPNCPFHGSLSVRGQMFTGKVVSSKANGMVVVEREIIRFIKKYRRFMRIRRKLHAKLPKCLEINEGDKVRVVECRPLSKTVSFIVIEKLGE